MLNIAATILVLKRWFLQFIQLQLFLTIVSLPIMLAWGLPISVLSPIGNLIFSPLLTLFLMLSSLIFFCELMHIPNGFLIHALETVTQWWLTYMVADNQTWLIGFVKPSIICMVLCACIPFALLFYKKTRTPYIHASCMVILLFGITLYLKCLSFNTPPHITIPCNRGAITMINHRNTRIMIDPGYIGQRISATSWTQYTLIPEIIKTAGSTTIDHCIVLQPNTMTFEALECLCATMTVKKIYIPYWQGQAPTSLIRAYFHFKRAAHDAGTMIVRINSKPHRIELDEHTAVDITPLETLLNTTTISYYACKISMQIDKQDITLYSAKYANKLRSSSKNNQ